MCVFVVKVPVHDWVPKVLNAIATVSCVRSASVRKRRGETSRINRFGNDIAQKKRKERDRENAQRRRVVSDACNHYRLTTLDPTSVATPSPPLPPPPPTHPHYRRYYHQHHLRPLPAADRRLLAFLSINSSKLHPFISFYLSYQTRFNNSYLSRLESSFNSESRDFMKL